MIGRTLAHYRITAAIGAGGMGEVYRATDTKLGRDVALKVLPAEMASSPERLERFRREAKALAALDHPGVVTVHSVEEAEGVHFLTMQLVEGQSLDRLMAGQMLDLERLVQIATAIADALCAAHERGVVHRDLKPANVVVGERGSLKVLDFGLAKMRPAGDAVVEGSVLRAGDKVRITAQLIDARADRHLWAKSFERSSRDVLALQNELASAIAREIHVQLTPAEQSRLASAPTVNPEAYDAYLKGRYFFNRPSDENLQKAIARFEDAISLHASLAPAHSGLSDAYLWAGYNEGFLTASEARPKAKTAAEKAIQLDDKSAEAHTSLAVFKLFYEYDWAGCEIEFRRAFALNPNYAFAHDQFSLGLAFQGRLEESIAESKRAAELDPLSPQVPLDAIFALAWQRKYQAAKEQARRSADLDPTYFFPIWGYGWVDIQAGKVKDSIPQFQKAKAMGSPAFVSAWLAYAYGASGDRARALAELEDLKKLSLRGSVTAFNLALVSLGLGDHARAVSYLEQAYASDSQWLGWLKGDRTFDPLRLEPRFAALMNKLRLEVQP